MKKQTPNFAKAMRSYIQLEFSNGVKFSQTDFLDLAKEFGVKPSSISSGFNYMIYHKLIEKVGELKVKGELSAWRLGIYKVIPGADWGMKRKAKLKTSFERKVVMTAAELRDRECGMRLHEIMNNIVRVNRGVRP